MGTGMPQSKLLREMHRSSRPWSMNDSISLTRVWGCRKSVVVNSSFSLSPYLDSLKKYASSLARPILRPQSGHTPSGAWVSVQNASQSVQYQPSYADL